MLRPNSIRASPPNCSLASKLRYATSKSSKIDCNEGSQADACAAPDSNIKQRDAKGDGQKGQLGIR